MRAATVRAHMKDCARIISAQFVGKIRGERSYATRLINGTYLDPASYWLPILRPDGIPIREPDGKYDKPVHARGPRGEQLNSLKTIEFLSPARLDFQLRILGESVKLADLETLFEYGGTHGYAGERGDGEGRYTYRIEQL